MDRAEAILLVAEKALQRIGELEQKIAALEKSDTTPKGVVSFSVDASGDLISVDHDGERRSLGRVVGEPGRDGRDIDIGSVQADIAARIANGLAAIPVPKDGFSLDDFDLIDGDRDCTFQFSSGDLFVERKIKKPSLGDVYRGVWDEKDGEWQRGDVVTWGGSLFLAQRNTKSKPESDDSWRLVVKRGREGKPGADGKNARTPQPVRVGP